MATSEIGYLLVLGEVGSGPVKDWNVDLLNESRVRATHRCCRAAVEAAGEAQHGLKRTKMDLKLRSK